MALGLAVLNQINSVRTLPNVIALTGPQNERNLNGIESSQKRYDIKLREIDKLLC